MTEADALHAIAVGAFALALGTSAFFRARAARRATPLTQAAPDRTAIVIVRLVALPLWILILVDPPWLRWSHVALPSWLRWAGAAAAILVVALAAWTLRSLGTNVTETYVTRREHQLVTAGPYRWVRHPLYSAGLALHAAVALLMASWLAAAMGAVAAALLPFRVRREEEQLLARFGDAYRSYRNRTGAFLPRLFH